MKYKNVYQGEFIDRPNRFIANVLINGARERVHVKNTGRCKELLEKGNTVFLEKSDVEGRKTAYDLVAVARRDGRMINMDSMAPNKAAMEWVAAGGLGAVSQLRAEVTVEDSRFDLACVSEGREMLIEVKGCTLERDGIAYFPDAPTARGVKHIRGLIRQAERGKRCVILIVIQMSGVRAFRPNGETDPEFASALRAAREAGVEVCAVECRVAPGEVVITKDVAVEL